MLQQWKDLFFLHFETAHQVLEPLLPNGMRLDSFEGKAYVGIVGFKMEEIKWSFCPSLSYPPFVELNLRTYVVDQKGTPCVYFFSLDAGSRLGVLFAKWLYHLPYFYSKMDYSIENGQGRLRSTKGEAFDFVLEQEKGKSPLSDFLLERYHFLTAKKGNFYQGALSHPPYDPFFISPKPFHTHLFDRAGIPNEEVTLASEGCYFCKGFPVKVNRFGKMPPSP